MSIATRIGKLRQSLAEKGLEGIITGQPENRRYLSGFKGSAGYILITANETIIATDFRYYEQVKQQCPEYTLCQMTGKFSEWFPGFIGGRSVKRLGFEDTFFTVAFHTQVTEILAKVVPAIELVPTSRIIEILRAVKEPEEITDIKEAIALSDRAFDTVEHWIYPGMTEKQVAWELEKVMRQMGSEALPFDIIVASGPNSALPHAGASDKVIKDGEPIVIDMGARFGGYASDLTRTIYLGKPDDQFRKVYSTVLNAQKAAIAGIKVGMDGQTADGLARVVIESVGWGNNFGHSLSHGVGLNIHEDPRLGPNSTDIVEERMVFSVEPGVYITGWGGVRIEDLAMMENGRLNVLSNAHKISLD